MSLEKEIIQAAKDIIDALAKVEKAGVEDMIKSSAQNSDTEEKERDKDKTKEEN